jgi:hypothetical protein
MLNEPFFTFGEGIIMYAIVETGGKQYRVEAGATIQVERLPGDVGAEIEISQVRLVVTLVFCLDNLSLMGPRLRLKSCSKDEPDQLLFLRKSAARAIAAPVDTDKDSPSC